MDAVIHSFLCCMLVPVMLFAAKWNKLLREKQQILKCQGQHDTVDTLVSATAQKSQKIIEIGFKIGKIYRACRQIDVLGLLSKALY